jgi:hypothetical protein
MIKLDGTTFTVSDRGLPLLLRQIPSSFAQPGKTIKVAYIAHDLHNRLVAGLTSNDQTYEIEVARLLSHGVFSGIESSEVLARAISKFQWQHPLLCLDVGVRVFLTQDPRFDIRWESPFKAGDRWVLCPYPLPPSPLTSQEIASVIYHEGFQEYQLLNAKGEVLVAFPGSPLRFPAEAGYCIKAPTEAITELWSRRESLYTEWQGINALSES